MLYGFNALTLDDRPIGLLLDVGAVLDETELLTRIALEHADKVLFRLVPFLPVWAHEVYPVWQSWQCLKGTGPFELPPFHAPIAEPVAGTVFNVSVAALARDYNPFLLCRWLWGCHSFAPALVLGYCRGRSFEAVPRHSRHGMGFEYHVARIAYLVTYPTNDTIHMTSYGTVGSLVSIENGNHRFAAAIIRQDKIIRATFAGNIALLEPYLEG